ncbi:MAG: nucleotide exchange factor GrpE [Bacilli bacterium]|nr:nucleotide exchange factor GrpE [Bacilli bacterium]
MTEEKREVEKEKKEKQECQCQNDKKEKCKCNHHDKKEKNSLKEENEQLKCEIANLIEKVKLAQAELINYRKRKDEEVSNFKKYCNQSIITDLIPIIDNFERAIKLDDNDLTDELSKFLEGFKMMYASLMEVLKKYGVVEISRQGEVFDSTLEEALMTDNLEEYDDEVVTEVLLKGYKLIDRVIRPASVKINKLD